MRPFNIRCTHIDFFRFCVYLFVCWLGAKDYSGALVAFESAARINPTLMPRLKDNMAVCHAAENVRLL